MPNVKFVDKGDDISMVGIVDMFKESDFHLSHGWGMACFDRIVNIKTVAVNGEFGGHDYFYDKLPYLFLLYRDVVKEYRGRFEGKVIICDKVDYLLSKFPVFYGIWTGYILVFRGLDLSNAKLAKCIIRISGLVRSFVESPVCPF